MHLRFDAFGHTDIGRQRSRNQDSYVCLPIGREPWGYLLAVADGMGGHAGGEIASEVAVAELRSAIHGELGDDGEVGPEELLWRAFQRANAAILKRAADDGLEGMGTTLVAAILAGDRAWLANVGDSRAYRIRSSAIERLTRDHSWEVEQAPKLDLAEEDIARSPFRGMLTRSLGHAAALEIDVYTEALAEGDRFLLCSDGLYKELSEERVFDLMLAEPSADRACRALVEAANEAGGRDNVTCVVAGVESAAVKREDRPRSGATQPTALASDARRATRGTS